MNLRKLKNFKYTFRTICGIDSEVTVYVRKTDTIEREVERVRGEFRHSVTPLVRLNGQKIDITPFLEKERESMVKEVERLENNITRLTNEIARRKKEK